MGEAEAQLKTVAGKAEPRWHKLISCRTQSLTTVRQTPRPRRVLQPSLRCDQVDGNSNNFPPRVNQYKPSMDRIFAAWKIWFWI